MSTFVAAFLCLSITDFSMSASIPEDAGYSDDDDGFATVEPLAMYDILTVQDDLGQTICRVLAFFKTTLNNIKGLYIGIKENQNDNDSPGRNETKEDFEKQCLEMMSCLMKISNSTETNLDKLRMILNMKKTLEDLRFMLVEGL